MKYKISAEQYGEIKAARQRNRENRDKQIENRLKVLTLRYERKSLGEIAAATGFHHAHISNLIRKYFEEGLPAISEKHYTGNRRNMSIEEEAAFLEPYREQAEEGHILDVREIETAYEEKVGHSIGSSQIYRVLHRHGWRKVMPRSKHPKKASEEVIATSKKIKEKVEELEEEIHKRCGNGGKVRLMFQDEAGFGRINKPKYCWCQKGFALRSPVIISGNTVMLSEQSSLPLGRAASWSCLTVIPVCMNLFLSHLAKQYPDDIILLCCDGAAWHKSGTLCVPENIRLFFIPPYTPEMNPMEQTWKELRKRGFRMKSLPL